MSSTNSVFDNPKKCPYQNTFKSCEPEDISSYIYQRLRPIFESLANLNDRNLDHENIIKFIQVYQDDEFKDQWKEILNITIPEFCKDKNIECFDKEMIEKFIHENKVQSRYLDIVNELYKCM